MDGGLRRKNAIQSFQKGAEVSHTKYFSNQITRERLCRYLLSAGHDNTARLWDLETHEQLRCFTGHQDGVTWAAFVPVAFHLRVVFYEEAQMERLFGEEWARYREEVPRWGVRLTPYRNRNSTG